MGYKPGSLARGAGELITGVTRITYLGKTTQPLWTSRGGLRMGKNQSATAWGAPVLFSAPTDTPTSLSLVARTDVMALTVTMTNDRSTGHNYEGAVQSPQLIPANTHLWGGGWSSSGDINFGQDASGALMREWNGSGGAPPNTITTSSGNYSSSPQGRMDTWWIFETNATPGSPVVIAPPSGGSTSDISPDIIVKFVDSNPGDSVSKWLIELFDETNSSLLYSSGVTNAPTGVSGDTITWNPGNIQTRAYRGRAYTWDSAGAKSPSRTWPFTVNAGGSVTSPILNGAVGTNANGDVVYNSTRPSSVTFTWTHQSGESTSTWNWRIVNAVTGAVVRSAVGGSFTVAPGATLSPNYVPEWTDLPRGSTRYAYEVQVEDALGGVTDWTRSPVFVVNASPSIGAFSPSDNFSQTTRPELVVDVSDATDSASSLTATFDVGGVSRAGSFRAPNQFVYQTTELDLPAPTIALDWDVDVVDPWGRSASLGEKTVNYVVQPSVTLTSPVGTIAIGAPTIAASVDRTVSSYRARITVHGTDVTVVDTETQPGSGSSISHPVPAGILRNATDYQLHLEGQTSDGLTFTVIQVFRVEYTPEPHLDDVALELMPSSVFDQGQHSQMPNVQITHGRLDESDISDTDFIGYVYRRYDGNGLGREWLVRNREVLGLVDRSAGHGLHSWYVGYRHYVNAGADIVDSEMVKATAMVNIRHTVITHDESDVAVTFKFWRERRVEQQVGTEVIVPLGRQKPYGFQSPTRYDRIRGVFKPLSEELDLYTAQQIAETAREMAAMDIRPDGTEQPKPLWYRDPRGRVLRVIFEAGVVSVDDHLLDRGELEITLSEIDNPEIIPMAEPTAVLDVS